MNQYYNIYIYYKNINTIFFSLYYLNFSIKTDYNSYPV